MIESEKILGESDVVAKHYRFNAKAFNARRGDLTLLEISGATDLDLKMLSLLANELTVGVDLATVSRLGFFLKCNFNDLVTAGPSAKEI